MKIDWSFVLLNPRGQALTIDDGTRENPDPKDATLEMVAYAALTFHNPSDPAPDGLKWARLSKKVVAKDELTLDEVSTIKAAVERCILFGSLFVMAIEDYFEGLADNKTEE